MDVFQTPGAISWHELMVDDLEAAKAFYSEVFGWTMEDVQMEGMDQTYTVISVGGTNIGGMMVKSPEAAGTPSSWVDYVTVDNVDDTLQSVMSRGGQVIVPPMDIPGVGRFAQVQDAEGAVIAIMTYETPAA